MISIDHILKLTEFLNTFRKVERMVYMNSGHRNENDVEHSYSLAMLGWYMNTVLDLKLNQEKIFTYALAHDLVEVYSGDVYFYTKDEKARSEKGEKERQAFLKIREQFSEFTELHRAIEAYEKREDNESKFVYALDKLEPILQIYLDGGRSWKRDGVTLRMLKENKPQKIKVDQTVEMYFNQLLKYLEQGEEELFDKENTEE